MSHISGDLSRYLRDMLFDEATRIGIPRSQEFAREIAVIGGMMSEALELNLGV